MARRENTFKKSLLKAMGTRWDVQSHEDQFSEGIPDLSYGIDGINGWIELKQIKEMPKEGSKIIKPEHYTSQQVNWLIKRGKKGGHCFILIKVGKNDLFLFNWRHARAIQVGLTLDEYRAHCDHHSTGFDQSGLIEQLSSSYP